LLHDDPVFLLLLKVATLYTGMKHTTFKEWLARRDEGFLLPDRPPLKGMPKINSALGTDAKRKRLHPKKVKPPKFFPPTVRAVKEIVPNKALRVVVWVLFTALAACR
jgi:hypothetical protein